MPVRLTLIFATVIIVLAILVWRTIYHARQAKLWKGYLRERHIRAHRVAAWMLCVFVGAVFVIVPWKIVPAIKKSPPASLLAVHVVCVGLSLACLVLALVWNGLKSKKHWVFGWMSIYFIAGLAGTGMVLYYVCR